MLNLLWIYGPDLRLIVVDYRFTLICYTSCSCTDTFTVAVAFTFADSYLRGYILPTLAYGPGQTFTHILLLPHVVTDGAFGYPRYAVTLVTLLLVDLRCPLRSRCYVVPRFVAGCYRALLLLRLPIPGYVLENLCGWLRCSVLPYAFIYSMQLRLFRWTLHCWTLIGVVTRYPVTPPPLRSLRCTSLTGCR